MTISTTLGVLAQAAPALQAIGALKLSAKAAYHIGRKLTPLVLAETTHFHELRNALLVELGTLSADGTTFSFTPEHAKEWTRRVTELSDIPVDISWGPITLAMLEDEKVSAADLQALGPLFAEPEGEAP